MSLCQGLDVILAPYRETLLQVERELLADRHLTVAYVQSALEEVNMQSTVTILVHKVTWFLPCEI